MFEGKEQELYLSIIVQKIRLKILDCAYHRVGAAVTVTLHVAVTPVTSHLAVIVAVPAPIPVKTPIGLTRATLSFDDVQVTPRPTAVAGV